MIARVLYLCLFFVVAHSSGITINKYNDVNETIGQQWSSIGRAIEPFIWPFKERILRFLEDVNDSEDVISTECRESLRVLTKGLKRGDKWAYQMMDSWGKFEPGFLNHRIADFGDFTQCLRVKVNQSSVEFRGKYCLYRLHWPLPPHRDDMEREISLKGTEMEGTWLQYLADDYKIFYYETVNNGICIPSTCSQKEVENAVQRLITKLPLKVEFRSSCDTEEDFSHSFSEYPPYKRYSIIALASFASLVVVSTLMSHFAPNLLPAFLGHFCAIENTRKLFADTTELKSMDSFNGIRFFFLWSSTFFHIAVCGLIWTPVTHLQHLRYIREPTNWFIDGFYSNYLSGMCINFVMGGLLTFYVWYPKIAKANSERTSFLEFFFRRWFRTTPVMVAIILIVLAFPVSWGWGPVFREGLDAITSNCLQSWWKELLFIGNQNHARDICLIHGWYLASDLHMFISSYFVMLVMHKNSKLGLSLVGALVFLGMVLQGQAVYATNSGPYFNTSTIDWKKTWDETNTTYFYSYNHLSSYYIGIFVGYLILNNFKFKQQKTATLALIAANAVWLLTCYCAHYWRYVTPTRLGQIVFAACNKVGVAVAVAVILFCCSNKQAGPYNWLFERRIFVSLTRFSYSAFMAHFLVLWCDFFTMTRPLEFRTFSMFMQVFYVMMSAIILGYFLYLVFEAPFVSISKRIFDKKKQCSRSKPADVHNSALGAREGEGGESLTKRKSA